MRKQLLAVALTAAMPALAFAQSKRGGATDPAPTPTSSAPSGGSGGGSSVKLPSSRDLSEMNPASLLIDKRKKASLADSTVAQLKAVEKKINDRNAPFFTTYDSVRKWTLPIGSSDSRAQSIGLSGGAADSKIASASTSPAEQAKMQMSVRDLRVMMGEFGERHKTDVADALAVVPEAQKKSATDLLGQQSGDLAKLTGRRP